MQSAARTDKQIKPRGRQVGAAAVKPRQLWRTDWFVAVVVVLAVLLLHGLSDVFSALERRYYDVASASSVRQPSAQIAIIAIDDRSIASLGRWPWPRELHARLIDQLAAAQVKTIAYTVPFTEPQTERGLDFIRKIKAALASTAADPATGRVSASPALAKIIAEAEIALDADARLGAAMARAATVVVPSLFVLGKPQGQTVPALPAFALKSTLDALDGGSLPALSGQQPLEVIGSAAAGVAHLNLLPDLDGSVRRELLLIHYDGKLVPSMSLLVTARSLNLSASDIRLKAGESLQLGELSVRTDPSAQLLPQFYKGKPGRPAFAVDSFSDVVSGKIPAATYAGKIVVVGVTATGIAPRFATPAGAGLSPAEIVAHTTSSLLSGHSIAQPGWGLWATWGAVLLVAVYLIVGLPRLTAGKAALLTLLLFLLLLTVEFGLLSLAAVWTKLTLPAALLLMGHLVLMVKRWSTTTAGKPMAGQDSSETSRMLGLALQGQGQLESAFERFRGAPFSAALMDNLNNLALAFERKREFDLAQTVYAYMTSLKQKQKAPHTRLNRAHNPRPSVARSPVDRSPALLLQAGGGEKPMLGRYQVEKELGKGAMSVVYLGRDPKIGRVVAIKTLALSQEFEGEKLDDARERFFREAETAGRLQHQNIVTIFDVGEERGLAYIAMEFLQGKDLTCVTQPAHLLPVPTVLSIVSRVAEALAYAHRQDVVHRDIKPANIMYDQEHDTVKVTDFGIARITGSSKTRTGLVLGTPSFMSPEQMAGKKVDGRADLYSLGVMLFQMLTGALPFNGESLAELMHQIAHFAAPDIRTIRKSLPASLAAVVARSLGKQPELRYQSGEQFAAELRAAMSPSASEPGMGASVGETGAEASIPATATPWPISSAFSETVTQQAAGAENAAFPEPASASPAVATDVAFEKTMVIRKPAAASPADPHESDHKP